MTVEEGESSLNLDLSIQRACAGNLPCAFTVVDLQGNRVENMQWNEEARKIYGRLKKCLSRLEVDTVSPKTLRLVYLIDPRSKASGSSHAHFMADFNVVHMAALSQLVMLVAEK